MDKIYFNFQGSQSKLSIISSPVLLQNKYHNVIHQSNTLRIHGICLYIVREERYTIFTVYSCLTNCPILPFALQTSKLKTRLDENSRNRNCRNIYTHSRMLTYAYTCCLHEVANVGQQLVSHVDVPNCDGRHVLHRTLAFRCPLADRDQGPDFTVNCDVQFSLWTLQVPII